MDVAHYMIDCCFEIGAPVSNTKLQNLLYYAQGQSLQATGQPLFKDEMYVWGLGVIIYKVHRKYSVFCASNIFKRSTDSIVKGDQLAELIIIKTLMEQLPLNLWQLIDNIKGEDPWKYNYQVYGKKTLIPVESIKNYFCSKNANQKI